MSNLIGIYNHNTQEQIERPMTDEELELWEIEQEENRQKKKEKEDLEIAKEAARQAILDKLGITAEEARLLLG